MDHAPSIYLPSVRALSSLGPSPARSRHGDTRPAGETSPCTDLPAHNLAILASPSVADVVRGLCETYHGEPGSSPGWVRRIVESRDTGYVVFPHVCRSDHHVCSKAQALPEVTLQYSRTPPFPPTKKNAGSLLLASFPTGANLPLMAPVVPTFISVESKDPRGRTVATAELTVSLSCLGAAGALFQLRVPSATTPSRPSGELGTATVSPPCCTPGVAQNNLPPTRKGHESTERPCCVAEKRGRRALTGEGAGKTPPSRGGRRGWCGRHDPGDASWTCKFNPRDGSLTEAAAPKAGEDADTVLDRALGRSENARGKPANDGEEDTRIAAGSSEYLASSKGEPAHGKASEDNGKFAAGMIEDVRCSPSSPGSCVSAAAAAAAAGAGAASTALGAAAEAGALELTAGVATSPASAVVNSEPDLVPPPLPESEGEEERFLGDAETRVGETGEEIAGPLDATDGIVTEEAHRVDAVMGRKTAGRILPGERMRIRPYVGLDVHTSEISKKWHRGESERG